jgi:7-cyano-7-deazaguanine synthase
LAVARNEGFGIYAISFDYGQRHRIELSLAKQCSAYFNVQEHRIIKLDLGGVGDSALLNDTEIRRYGDTEMQKEEDVAVHRVPVSPRHRVSEIPPTYVPARNTIFLSFALAFAEGIGAEDIFIGANAVDYSGYPDCRPEFINAFENMANLATKASVEGTLKFKIRVPLINLSKGEIIKKGVELDVDLSLTWSCYDPQPATAGVKSSKLKVQSFKEENSKLNSSLVTRHSLLIPCGRCDSCLLRAKGFREAGVGDILSFKVKH